MKKIVIILAAIALIAMIGTAAANPESIDILIDGTSTVTPNPIIMSNNGIDNNYDLRFHAYYTGTAGTIHNLTVTFKALDGFNLANNEITLKAKERDGGAIQGTITSDGSSNTLILKYDWDQDDMVEEFIDIVIVSNGPDNRKYSIKFDDVGPDQNNYIELGTENRGINNVPEFPTIALPIAAILGLAFIFQRRKEEE